jgi:hypothetical protein
MLHSTVASKEMDATATTMMQKRTADPHEYEQFRSRSGGYLASKLRPLASPARRHTSPLVRATCRNDCGTVQPADHTKRRRSALSVLTSTYILSRSKEGDDMLGILTAFADCCVYNENFRRGKSSHRREETECEIKRYGVCEMWWFGNVD